MPGTRIPKTLYITGGMSGLGKGLAAIYLARGSDVAIFDLAVRDDVMAELAGHKSRHGQKLVAYQASVTELEALQAAVAQAVETIGDPELAVNCSGPRRLHNCPPLTSSW